jgi:hypothetical protein
VTAGLKDGARYREAALVALFDLNGNLFFARLEEWEDLDRELNREEGGPNVE